MRFATASTFVLGLLFCGQSLARTAARIPERIGRTDWRVDHWDPRLGRSVPGNLAGNRPAQNSLEKGQYCRTASLPLEQKDRWTT